VLQATGRRSLAEVGGLARSMPWTAFLAVVGVLSMAAPLTLGFVSKSMIAQAAGDLHRIGLWLALAAASAGVFVAVGLRFVWFTFFGPDSGLRPADPPLHMRLAMLLLASLCVGLGVWYEPLYRLLPFPVDYAPYTGSHVVAQLQLLLGAALVFFALRRSLAPARSITLDVDWLYRRALPRVGGALSGAWYAAAHAWHSAMAQLLDRAAAGVRRMHGPEGLLARTWSVRSMGLWMLVMLLGLLLIGYAS
jgi:multicomponent Na+:H+ antiporter subunit D